MLLLALIIGLENDHENQVAKYLVHMIHMDQMLVPMKKYRMILQNWSQVLHRKEPLNCWLWFS